MDLVETVIYTGPVPWWMAGQTGDSKDGRGLFAGEEAATAAQLLQRYRLDKFRVEKREAAFWSDSRQEFFKVEGERFLVRTDTGVALGRCTEKYQERQIAEQFAFWDRVVGEGLARYRTAGILDGGKKVFLSLQAPGSWSIKRQSGKVDKHVPYFLDSLDNTGKGSNWLAGTDVNTVCMNTHNLALHGSPLKWAVSHRGDLDDKYEVVAQAILEIAEAQDEERRTLQALANEPMGNGEFIGFATSVFLGADGEREEIEERVAQWFEKASDRSKTILRNKVVSVTELFHHGIGNEGVSKYDALQAFTEYFDHFDIGEIRDKVERGKRAARALTSSVDGSGAKVKERVRERLVRSIS